MDAARPAIWAGRGGGEIRPHHPLASAARRAGQRHRCSGGSSAGVWGWLGAAATSRAWVFSFVADWRNLGAAGRHSGDWDADGGRLPVV